MQSVIGIPGFRSSGGEFFGAGVNHLAFISRFGVARIIMPWEDKVKVDLLYLPGGLDLAPNSYNEVPGFNTSNQDVMKQFFYDVRLGSYIKDTPIFGVCLGMQMLGAYFGAKLTQDLINHPESEDRWVTAHDVWNPTNDKDCFEVNSHHHQCIRLSQLPGKLRPRYIAECAEPMMEEDFIVEAFEHVSLPIVAVQWHPEEMRLDNHFAIDTMKGLLI